MSRAITDQQLIDGLRALMKERKVSVSALAKGIEVPYRTLQNYLIGQARFPAAVFMQCCEYLGIEQSPVVSGSFALIHGDLFDALISVFGDTLRHISCDEDTGEVSYLDTPNRDPAYRGLVSSKLAKLVSSEYDRYRRQTLRGQIGPYAPPTVSDFEKRLGKELAKRPK